METDLTFSACLVGLAQREESSASSCIVFGGVFKAEVTDGSTK